MVFWFVASLALLVWNAAYCARNMAMDFRGPKPANGVWGLFALAGAVSTIAMMVFAALVSGSGI